MTPEDRDNFIDCLAARDQRDFAAQQRELIAKMGTHAAIAAQWEYRLVYGFITDELNEFGCEGWEVVNAWVEEQYNGRDESSEYQRVCLMKRRALPVVHPDGHA